MMLVIELLINTGLKSNLFMDRRNHLFPWAKELMSIKLSILYSVELVNFLSAFP